jgi:hypothetical protein
MSENLNELRLEDQNPAKKNPLANWYRQPKIYVKLPSKGKFYKTGAIDLSANEEYPVYAMTAKDELMFKTPDALMNGQATVEVIKSCVPAIKNPWQMPSIDLDAVLIAIRLATYGENLDVSSSCPSCGHLNDYILNLLQYLDTVTNFNYQSSVPVGELMVNIRPYSYKELNKTALKTLEQQKIFQIVNDESMPDEEKVAKFGDSFVKLTQLTVDTVIGCIQSIDTPDGNVSNQDMIKEFIENAPSDVFTKISEHITEMKDSMSLKVQNVECTECQHQWNVDVSMDQTNFFAKGS